MVLQKHPPASNVESPILLDDIFIIAHQVTCHKRFQLNTTPQKGWGIYGGIERYLNSPWQELLLGWKMDHSVYGLSQWETMFLCNVTSYSLIHTQIAKNNWVLTEHFKHCFIGPTRCASKHCFLDNSLMLNRHTSHNLYQRWCCYHPHVNKSLS